MSIRNFGEWIAAWLSRSTVGAVGLTAPDVQLGSLLAGEDLTNNVMRTQEQGGSVACYRSTLSSSSAEVQVNLGIDVRRIIIAHTLGVALWVKLGSACGSVPAAATVQQDYICLPAAVSAAPVVVSIPCAEPLGATQICFIPAAAATGDVCITGVA